MASGENKSSDEQVYVCTSTKGQTLTVLQMLIFIFAMKYFE